MSFAIPFTIVPIFACARQIFVIARMRVIKNMNVVSEIVASITIAPSSFFCFMFILQIFFCYSATTSTLYSFSAIASFTTVSVVEPAGT